MAIEASIGASQATSSVPSSSGNAPLNDRNKPAKTSLTLFQECQPLLRQRLTPALLATFQRLTGLALHLDWTEPLAPPPPDSSTAVVCPMAKEQAILEPSGTAECGECVEHYWPRTQVGETGWFTGRCGAQTLCVVIAVADLPMLRLVAQLEPDRTETQETLAPPASDALLVRLADAEALLRLLTHDLEMTLQSHLLACELRGLATVFVQQPELPSDREMASRRPLGPHAQQVVQAMLDYVRDHYQRPMVLKEVAAALGMNANYLSGLFHKATGTAFHRYVHAVRMSKAEALLRDPRMRICDVASAVGYASPNHFRNAFKACEKLPPKAWLERQESSRRPSWPGPWDQDWVEI